MKPKKRFTDHVPAASHTALSAFGPWSWSDASLCGHEGRNRVVGIGRFSKTHMEAFSSLTAMIPVHAVHTRSERSKDLVSLAYKEKYKTPGPI